MVTVARLERSLTLCSALGYTLPGTNTIPEQIAKNKRPYYEALEAADKANEIGKLDLSAMEKLLEDLLGNQLVSVYNAAKQP
jgi:hypothetical protein